MKRRPVGIGIIGGGLMGRETASAFARWRALTDVTVEPQLVGVADLNPAALEWFDDGRTFLTRDYRELLDRDEIEILYVAVVALYLNRSLWPFTALNSVLTQLWCIASTGVFCKTFLCKAFR